MPAGEGRSKLRVRKSRFLARVVGAGDLEGAVAVRGEERERHRDATHHVYAFRPAEGEPRWDDDGEPAGTAGRPVLAALEREGVFRAAAVVTRYFGGTELGTGGLSRAYREAAARAVADVPTAACVPGRLLALTFPYADTGAVMRAVEESGAERRGQEYGQRATLHVAVPEERVGRLRRALREVTAGRARVEEGTRPVLIRI